MQGSPTLRRRFWAGFAAFTAVPAVALAVAWAAGWMAWPAALLLAAALGGTNALLLRNHTRHMRALIGYVETFRLSLDHNLPDPPSPRGSLLSTELDTKLVETTRERQRRRRELETVIAGNEAILATLPYPLLTLTGTGRIARANPAAEAVFDQPMPGRELVAALRDPALLSAVDQVLAGARERSAEFAVTANVERHFVAHVARLPAPLLDETAAILALLDVTALKRAEQLRADFVANASHELRTPLASLLGFIETLRGPARDDRAAHERFLAIMQEQAERMARLVEDLLSLSRIELREHTPPNAAADLATILTGVRDALELRAKRRGMTLVLELEEPLPPVLGEADELAQVFQNLVDNAIKYGRAGSAVEIRARVLPTDQPRLQRLGGRAVAASVIDHGDGISREHLPRLTERFYRVDTARSREMGGTGLGLAIVKHIVNRHRGFLEIDSEVGRGSTFTVYLRAKAMRTESAGSPPPAARQHASR